MPDQKLDFEALMEALRSIREATSSARVLKYVPSRIWRGYHHPRNRGPCAESSIQCMCAASQKQVAALRLFSFRELYLQRVNFRTPVL